MSDICPACNTTMTTVPSEHDGATGYYVCPHCNGDCEHGRQRRKCETCSAWESAVYNQRRAECAELQLAQTQADAARGRELVRRYRQFNTQENYNAITAWIEEGTGDE